jgi:hypothetical protein
MYIGNEMWNYDYIPKFYLLLCIAGCMPHGGFSAKHANAAVVGFSIETSADLCMHLPVSG